MSKNIYNATGRVFPYVVSVVEHHDHGDDLLHPWIWAAEGERLPHGRVPLHYVLKLGGGDVVVLEPAMKGGTMSCCAIHIYGCCNKVGGVIFLLFYLNVLDDFLEPVYVEQRPLLVVVGHVTSVAEALKVEVFPA